ncbi:MAG: SDR family oxidoreductase [Myxococcales bacterium]|nr:SDR family oxidoreductase [Myxococcales bacterium]MCB9608262.1 SDR family oxidoreductase [Polyangiaceae bacterium]
MGWSEADVGAQAGRVAIVTGSNSGIGFETARVLGAHGARVVLACRNTAKAEEALGRIKSQHREAQVEVLTLDLSSLESVKDFAQRFRADYGRLDLLINNAGVMMPPFGKTKEGFELQFGTNHLGHFALTAHLIDLVNAAPDGRVVSVSSVAHRFAKLDFDNLNAEKGYSKLGAYGQSKLANLLFTYELDRRLKAAGVSTISAAAHPGWTSTNLQRTTGWIRVFNPFFGMQPLGGALPTLRAATDAGVPGGTYWGPSGLFELRGAPHRVESNKRSHEETTAAQLWDVSERLTGVAFPEFARAATTRGGARATAA